MKIASIEHIPVAYSEPHDFYATRYLCLVKITTDDGVVGWGESITQFPEANPAVASLITSLSDSVIGQDPVNTEKTWKTSRTGRGGTGTAGVSPPLQSQRFI